jgi:hypothetical protein
MADTKKIEHQADVLIDVWEERERQDKKWGVQDHPITDPGITHLSFYNMPPEYEARLACEDRFSAGIGSWADILIEELAEVLAAGKNPVRAREELVQLAAVAVAAIECLDRKYFKSPPPGEEA